MSSISLVKKPDVKRSVFQSFVDVKKSVQSSEEIRREKTQAGCEEEIFYKMIFSNKILEPVDQRRGRFAIPGNILGQALS